MAKKQKRDHGTAENPQPVTYTIPEPEATQAAEAPKAEVKVKTPKPVDFAAEKEARAVARGTKLAALLASLAQGATMEQLIEVASQTGSKVDASGVRSWLGYDVRRAGYGVRQDGPLFYLVFPEGMTEVAYREAKAPAKDNGAEPKLKVERGSAKAKKAAMSAPRSKKSKRVTAK